MGEKYIPILIGQGRDVEPVSLYPEEPEFIWHAKGARPPRPVPAPVVAERAAPELPLGSLALAASALAAVVLGASGRLRRGPAWIAAGALGALCGLAWNRAQPRVRAPWHRGVTVPAPQQALELFETLHRNVYAAFDADTEDEIYDPALDQRGPEPARRALRRGVREPGAARGRRRGLPHRGDRGPRA